MRTIITGLMASAISLAAFQAANAADAIDEFRPLRLQPTPSGRQGLVGRLCRWHANWHHGKSNATGDRTSAGFGGGLYGGYNMQSGQIVYGPEVDLNYAGNDSANGTNRPSRASTAPSVAALATT